MPLQLSPHGETMSDDLQDGSTRKWDFSTRTAFEETQFSGNLEHLPGIYVDTRIRVAPSPDGRIDRILWGVVASPDFEPP
jgi:hypothetical protein